MRALVIGGTSFVGRNLVERLLLDGHSVRFARRRDGAHHEAFDPRIEFVDATRRDGTASASTFRGFDVAFLLAGHHPRYSVDREGELAAAEGSVRSIATALRDARVPRVVHLSHIAALRRLRTARAVEEDDVPAHVPASSVFRAVKWTVDREIDEHQARGLPVVTVYGALALGPHDRRLDAGGLLLDQLRQRMRWWVDGTLNVVDVDDLGRAMLAAADAPPGSRFCAVGHTLRVHEFLKTVAERYGVRPPSRRIEPHAARVRANMDECRASPVRERVTWSRALVDLVTMEQPVSSSSMARDLGVEPSPLGLTLDRARESFVAQSLLAPVASDVHAASREPHAKAAG